MKLEISAICSSMIGLLVLSSPALAQQKTVTACQEEWRASQTPSQANGVTEKAYVEQCRGGGAQAPASTAASAAPSPTTLATTGIPPLSPTRAAAIAGQRTVKSCQEEWRADKASNQANGVTEKAYVERCRVGGAQPTASAAPSAASSPTPVAMTGIPPLSPTRTTPIAGQKTVKSCREEWRANKASNLANEVTEKAYVEQCRGGGVPVETTATRPSPSVPALWRPATTGIPPLLPNAAP